MTNKPKVIPKWKLSNSISIPIKDMDTQHIKNTINYLCNRGKTPLASRHVSTKDQWIKRFQKELTKRNII